MTMRQIILLVTFTAAAITAALAQNGAAPGAGGAIPNLAGMWFHPTSPGFEPPVSGPGPILNKSRRRDGKGNFNQLVGDYTNPILKPNAAEIVKKHGEISLSGIGYPTPSDQCWPQPVPFLFWAFRTQLLQQRNKVTLIYSTDHHVRHVPLNEPHPAQLVPSWTGNSVGHYEGDTLVIDTVGFKVGPYSMVDWFGTPHTTALRVIERYRMIDYEDAKEAWARDAKENVFVPQTIDYNDRGKHLQLHFTVEDEGVFTTPWSATITYWKGLDPWLEQPCAENRTMFYYGKDADLPTARTPDF
jgi:hypothetical protein